MENRALYITCIFNRGFLHLSILFVVRWNSLEDRRRNLSRLLFENISNTYSCLHHLFPPLRDTSVISRKRSTAPYRRSSSRYEKLQSLINFSQNIYQSPVYYLDLHPHDKVGGVAQW